MTKLCTIGQPVSAPPLVVGSLSSFRVEQISHANSIEFSEDGKWHRLPDWVAFLLRFGYEWLEISQPSRRISVISMPSDSAASGIVALGAMRKRFALVDANDSVAHYKRIARSAATRDVGAFLRHKDYKGRFLIDSIDARGMIWVRCECTDTRRLASRTKLTRTIILPETASEWHFDGEAPICTSRGSELPYRSIYQNILEAPPVVNDNLTRSDSSVCIAGRATGKLVSKSICAGTKFRYSDEVADLAELLTVQDWSPKRVSRMNFFNTRTGVFDRNTGFTSLVVADGDAAFLKAVDAAEFTTSDIIGVVHRTVARENLEAIGAKLSSLRQWYVPETASNVLPPVGITISTLRRDL